MSARQLVLLVLLHICMVCSVHAQCIVQLSGTVNDKHTREGLSFAIIEIKELNLKTTADSAGHYVFTALCPGRYTVVCVHPLCDTMVREINLEKDRTLHFYPEHHSDLLDEVGIVGHMDAAGKTLAKAELKGLDFERVKGRSLGQALKSITGVSLLQTGSSIAKPVIHGLHSNRVLILNNGIRMEGQQWGNEHAPEVDPFVASQVTVVKGANAVRYGADAIGGVILVEPPPLPDSGKFSGQVNMLGSTNGKGGTLSAILEQHFKKLPAFSWRAQGTLKKAGNLHTPGYYLQNTGMEEYNFSYAAGFRKKGFEAEVFYSQFNTNIGIFTGAHIGNVTDLLHAIDQQKPVSKNEFSYTIARPRQHIEHELFKAAMRISTGNTGSLHITYARQFNLRQEYDKDKPLNDSLAALNLPELDFSLTTHLTEVFWEHVNIRHFTGKIGVSGSTQGNTYSGRFFIPNFRQYTGGVFVIERYVRAKYELEIGLRYDYRFLHVYMYEDHALVEPTHRYANVSANLGAVLRQGDCSRVLINAATAWRAPAINELYSDGLHHGSATVEKGDRNLNPERVYNITANWQYMAQRFTFEVEPYMNYFNGYINLVPVQPPTVTIRGAFPTYVFRQVDALFTGIDAKLQQQYMPWLMLVSKASVLRARDITAGNWLFGVPSDRFEQEFMFKAKNGKHFKQNFFSIAAAWQNKQFRVPAGMDYMPSPKGYFLLGCDMGTTWKIHRQELMMGVDVQNLLNQKYRDFMNRFRYYADETGTNVTIRLTYKF